MTSLAVCTQLMDYRKDKAITSISVNLGELVLILISPARNGDVAWYTEFA